MIRFATAIADRGCRIAGLPLPISRPFAVPTATGHSAPEGRVSSPSSSVAAGVLHKGARPFPVFRGSGKGPEFTREGDLVDLPDWPRKAANRYRGKRRC